MKSMKVKLTFLEPVLGTCPNDEEIYTRFIGDKAPDAPSLAEEVEAGRRCGSRKRNDRVPQR